MRQRNPNLSYKLSTFEYDEEPTEERPPPVPSLLDKGKTKKRRIAKDHSLAPTDPQNDAPPPQINSTPPSFAPIIPKCPPHNAYNTLPVRIQHQQAVELMDILSLFLTTSLIEQIAINTNAYATQKIAEREQEGVGSGESYWRGNCVFGWVLLLSTWGCTAHLQ